jgi:transposase
MKKICFFIGVDVSKLTLDVAIINGSTPNSILHSSFSNTKTGISELLSWVRKNSSKVKEELIFCMEHTGVYSLPLCSVLSEKKFVYTLVPALEIQRSSGIQRGKSDAADAKLIAKYAYLRRDSIKITTIPDKALLKLRHLIAYRERVIRCKVMFENTKDTETFSEKETIISVKKETKQMIEFLKKQIARLDQQLENIIKKDPVTKLQYELITSIPGIGLQIAANMIAYTRAFTCFDDPRKFACYSGVAPFPFQSGSSIKGRTKVNHLANKKIKSLLSMSALLVVRNDTEMRLYYERKVKEGKNKMLVLNAIRNKVIQRIFAVIKRGSPFVPLAKYAA